MLRAVSVIIPAYNAMAFLPEALRSILNQTMPNFEVIIVNDGSKDNIVEWASRITDPRVKLISQDNQGVSQARNTGILNSRGTYIAFLDADDIWEPTKLEKQVKAFELNPKLGLVDTQVLMVDPQDNVLYQAGSSYAEGNVLRLMLEENLVMCGSSPMIHRKCIEKVGLFDTDLQGSEDWNMWTRIALHYPFKVITEPLVRYRQHPMSASKDWKRMSIEATKSIERIFAVVPSNLHWIKNRTHAHSNIYCAKLARLSGQYRQSLYYCIRAFSFSPQACFTRDYFRILMKNLLHLQ